MKKYSAGILVYRRNGQDVEVLLAHAGGPFWAKKDLGAWSIPKGEIEPDEDLLVAAKREFMEEIGQPAPEGAYQALGSFTRSDGKQITAWAVEGTLDASHIYSNTFEMEWPPKSGKLQQFPEIDKADWFTMQIASLKMHKGQSIFIGKLAELLGIQLGDVKQPKQQSLL